MALKRKGLARALPRGFRSSEAFLREGAAQMTASAFRAAVASVASSLPADGTLVNACASRLRFLIAFAAAVARGRTTLLPASHASAALAELVAAHPGCVVIDDAFVGSATGRGRRGHAWPRAEFIAAIAHTSGSTGCPVAHAKHWSGLQAITARNAATLRTAMSAAERRKRPWIVATVPPQHMYGLEISVLLPLLGGFGIHGGRPLLPADVAAALAQVPAPRVLVSSPVHLRVLAESDAVFPEVAVVASATAPLSQDLARRVERRLGAVLVELFGSTETCVIATRRTARQSRWRPYRGVRLEPAAAGTRVRAPWFREPQLLQDILERGRGRFSVVGRHNDLVEIAGKRASLADLTRRIAALPGVRDAYVFRPAARSGAGIPRCAALAVAPGIPAERILEQLRQQVDAVFLPRPLVLVDALPRNDVGKLSLAQAEKLLAATGASRPRRGK